jgi:hypothetical protein
VPVTARRVSFPACLKAGANGLGGTLVNECITRAAGAIHGQEMTAEAMDALLTEHRQLKSFSAAPLSASTETPPRRNKLTSPNRNFKQQRHTLFTQQM